MNERTIQLAISSTIRSSIVVAAPNYTPAGWWECDLWAVTRAGYAVEYEIKVSAADFRADAKKQCRVLDESTKKWVEQSKHDQLRSRKHAPSRFFFVFPPDLAHLEHEVPEWAGVGICRSPYRVSFVREAPRLHTRKVGSNQIRLAQKRMWYRYWNVLRVMHSKGIAEVTEAGAQEQQEMME